MLNNLAARVIGFYLQRTPKHRGRFQVVRLLMSLAGETPVRSAYGVKLLPNPTDATNVLAMIGGALDNVADLVSTTAPGMAFIDIGANNGVFSMMAAQRAGENGCVKQ